MKRHATDVLSLLFGTLFLGLTAVWLLDLTRRIDRHDMWLAGPIILIAAGTVGLVASLRRSTTADEPADRQRTIE
jgi:hypothetical protein